MAKWMEHEKQAIRLMIGDALPKNVLEDVLGSDKCEVNYTGYGYYLTVGDGRLPVEKDVFDGPADGLFIGANPSGFECGYVIFVKDRQLTLELFPWDGESLPSDFRETKVEVRVQPKSG